jgi:hypothetical protein
MAGGDHQGGMKPAEPAARVGRLASNEVRSADPCFRGLGGRVLRPLVVDVEDEFRLRVRRLASAHLVYRRM